MRWLSGGLLGRGRLRNVVVHCRGGLGNQLFQASAGYLVAKELETSLYLDLSLIAVHNSENPVDICRLEVLQQYSTPLTFRGKLRTRLILKLNWMFPSFDLSSVGTFSPGNFDRVFRTLRTIHLYGYFADFSYGDSSKLFEGEINLIKPSTWFMEMANTISKKPVVALHVRRGDFLANPEHYGILGANYYKNAITAIPSGSKGALIWVFSDSLSLAQEMLSQIHESKFEYISPPPNSNALESLILMSLAEGLIVANSTFSFWAAYISKKSKFICYPARDRNGQVIVKGIPTEWIQIEESWN
jgi:hypothetical protein